jgi:uncharacterized protein YxeA
MDKIIIIIIYITIYIAMMGRTFKKNAKSHRKKSNVRKSRSFRKKRNEMIINNLPYQSILLSQYF